MQTLRTRIEKAAREVVAAERLRKDRQAAVKRLEEELTALGLEQALLTKVDATLLAVSSKVLGQSLETIDKLVTAGLKAVFNDLTLEFKTKIDKSRGKTSVEFLLFSNGVVKPMIDSYGGGVIVVAGVLLRIATIIVLNMKRILVLDESLSMVSEQYIPATSKLLKKICTELDFTVIMITHQPMFAESADVHYVAKPGKEGTTFEKVKSSN